MRGEGAGQQPGFNVQGRGSAADWGQGTRGGAHQEHVAHVRDAGGVEAQRLVERIRGLPRVERRAYGVRGGGELRHRWREMAGDAPSSVQGRARVEIGSRARGGFQERTRNMKLMSVTLDVSKLSGWLNADALWNMPYMVVTLEVSQLEISALKSFKSLKR